MKQLFLEKGSVKPHEVPLPPLSPLTIRVKVLYSFISTGTEGASVSAAQKSLFAKTFTNTKQNLQKVLGAVHEHGFLATRALIKESQHKVQELGYSCSGQIVDVGTKLPQFNVGDYVACAGAGIANHAEYITVPANLAVRINDPEFIKQASLTTIGSIAMQGIRRANLQIGETVCVIGLGLIGQITVQLAKLSGCTVWGIDIDEEKLQLAEKLGCDRTYNNLTQKVLQEIAFHSHHQGVDTTIITAASASGAIMQQAMEITRRKGKVVLVGDVKIDFSRSPFYEKEIDFLISCSYGPGRYDPSYEQRGIDYPYSYVRWTEQRNMQCFADLIQQKKINIDALVSHTFPFAQAEKAYVTLGQRKSLGILLAYEAPETPELVTPETVRYEQEEKPEEKRDVVLVINKTIAYADANKQPLRHLKVATVGAGGFAKIKLLPILTSLKNISVHTVIDTNPAAAQTIASLYQAQKYDNDYKTVLADPNVDAVIIATPHAFHTQQAIDFLRAGKAVFLEKPAAINQEQLDQLTEQLSKKDCPLFCVDFNRSFAPFIQKIKHAVTHRTTPLIAHYRMNAGFIPQTHWVQSLEHGGRIIGEACHIFELFTYLTEAKPTTISVNPINAGRTDIQSRDNFSATISYSDGSTCTLLYTAMGDTNLPKERMEIFFDGKAIIMDDYTHLYGYGLQHNFNESTWMADKGHYNLLSQFMLAIQKGGENPLSIQRIVTATKLSLLVNQQIKS